MRGVLTSANIDPWSRRKAVNVSREVVEGSVIMVWSKAGGFPRRVIYIYPGPWAT